MDAINYDTEEKAAERVAIAQDALAWIEAGALKPSIGYIVHTTNINGLYSYMPGYDGDKQLRDINLGECSVCARGALLLAKAVRFDNVKIRDVNFGSQYWNRHVLNEHFSNRQIDLIETYYEGRSYWHNFEVSESDSNLARDFYRREHDKTERMKLILNNIIANNGTFIPEKL